jgi:hypothetical protein
MKKLSLPIIGLLQASGLATYVSLVAMIFWKGNTWFGKMDTILGPVAMLSLFVVSAMICALITLSYPFIVFWDKKNTKQALKIIMFTAAWLVFFVIVFLSSIALSQ